ncbi:MAG: ABC transporter substrate-binding protein [Alphaproteobacteria bacterium]|nr:ABC transporter substrate-binding protein [Alphaproteobacteria bacterium]
MSVAVLTVVALLAAAIPATAAETNLKIGWCAKTITSAASPFAIATKLGWYKAAGISVELVPLPGSTDCVKLVATGELPYSLPSDEPLAIILPQGVKARIFYTAYQGYIYGIRVPEDSPIKSFADLKGKAVGVAAMSSAGYIVARAVAANNGLNPDTDIRIVAIGEGAQAAAMVRGNQVQALSIYDTQYTLIENTGVKLRALENKDIQRYPSNGFVALDDTLAKHRAEAVALASGYARGTVFAMANPEAAVRILWEVYPQTKPTGKDEATALSDDVKALLARAESWKLENAGVKRWGESNEANYAAYNDFMLKWGIIKQPADAKAMITNDLIDDINKFDPAAIEAEAKAYKMN